MIQAVTFQKTGPKGWDDVMVETIDGSRRFYQVKHTRRGDEDGNGKPSLSFSDMAVATTDEPRSLLEHLFNAWRKEKADPERDRFILWTNKELSLRPYTPRDGWQRPSLASFWKELQPQLVTAAQLNDIQMRTEWREAWACWLEQLKAENDEERLAFLKRLDFEIGPDLPQLEIELKQRLADQLGVPQGAEGKVTRLWQALVEGLKTWTTFVGERERVTPEALLFQLGTVQDPHVARLAPLAPEPFFSSRNDVLTELRSALLVEDGPSIIFLEAEPGAGKTSIISRLTDGSTLEEAALFCGVRYFAFKPFRPGDTENPGDHSVRIKPSSLWFGLLGEIRSHGHVKGHWHDLRVPLWDELLTGWEEARAAVLRIADAVARRLGRPFALVIDGIDHAARAMSFMPEEAKAFFDSLPTPDEMGQLFVRVLLAGQPIALYREIYPSWLADVQPRVRKLDIPALSDEDIRAEFAAQPRGIPRDQLDAAIQVISTLSRGNTLSVVFAIAEATTVESVAELETRLKTRRLSDGIEAYYREIWRTATALLGPTTHTAPSAMALALSHIQQPIEAGWLVKAFVSLNITESLWIKAIENLTPLLAKAGAGWVPRFNDVRLFLEREAGTKGLGERQYLLGLMADYYLGQNSDRLWTHRVLFTLIKQAGREAEVARIFDEDWLYEAAALGCPIHEICDQAAQAVKAAPQLRDWDAFRNLAHAVVLVDRLRSFRETSSVYNGQEDDSSIPSFLTTELHTFGMDDPDSRHTAHDEVRMDLFKLLLAGEILRAQALYRRRIGDQDLLAQMEAVRHDGPNTRINDRSNLTMLDLMHHGFDDWGRILRWLGNSLPVRESNNAWRNAALGIMERGWVEQSLIAGPFDSIEGMLQRRFPTDMTAISELFSGLSCMGQWQLINDAAEVIRQQRDKLPIEIRSRIAWLLIRGAGEDVIGWAEPLLSATSKVRSKWSETENSVWRDFDPCVYAAALRGWHSLASDTGAIVSPLLSLMRSGMPGEQDFNRASLQIAVLVGRIRGALERRGEEVARELIVPTELESSLTLVWLSGNGRRYWIGSRGIGFLVEDLIDLAWKLGGKHRDAVLSAARGAISKVSYEDGRLTSVCRVLQMAGELSSLRTTIEDAVGINGTAWQEGGSNRKEIVSKFIKLSQDISDDEVSRAIETRYRWNHLTIETGGGDDHFFHLPAAWLDAAWRVDPSCWDSQGLRLAQLAFEAGSRWCQDRGLWDIHSALGAAAFANGPQAVWQLYRTFPWSGDHHHWLDQSRSRFLDGALSWLETKPALTVENAAALWCLWCGFTRWWHDSHVAQLELLRVGLLNSISKETDKKQLTAILERVCPGEIERGKRAKLNGERNSPPPDPQIVDKKLCDGIPIQPAEALVWIKAKAEKSLALSELTREQVLGCLGEEDNRGYGWRSYGAAQELAIKELAAMLDDNSLWIIANSIARKTDGGTLWPNALCNDLQTLSRVHDMARGEQTARKGIASVVRMVERMMEGPKGLAPIIPVCVAAPDELVVSWIDVTMGILSSLLESRSAEVITTALAGLRALADIFPAKVIPNLMAQTSINDWKSSWILLLAEVWATRFPTEMLEWKNHLEKLGSDDANLAHAAQAWICLSALALAMNQPVPEWIGLDWKPEDRAPELLLPPLRSNDWPDRTIGFENYPRREQMVSRFFDRLESTTEMEWEEGRRHAAYALADANDEDDVNSSDLRSDGDTMHGGLVSVRAVEAGLKRMRQQNLLPKIASIRVVQSFLPSDEAWLAAYPPRPHPDFDLWPSAHNLHDVQKGDDENAMRKKMRFLAEEAFTGDDEMVVGAQLFIPSYSEDWLLRCWTQEWPPGLMTQPEILLKAPSGRSLTWSHEKAWYPSRKSLRSLVEFAGGMHFIHHATSSIVPAKLWRDTLGWAPSLTTPFIWRSSLGDIAARYERWHGPTQDTHKYHFRQPMLERWVVSRSCFVNSSTGKLMPSNMFHTLERKRATWD